MYMSRSLCGIYNFRDLNTETGLNFIRPRIEISLNEEA